MNVSIVIAFLVGGSIGVIGVYLLDTYGNERLIGSFLGAIIMYAVMKGMVNVN